MKYYFHLNGNENTHKAFMFRATLLNRGFIRGTKLKAFVHVLLNSSNCLHKRFQKFRFISVIKLFFYIKERDFILSFSILIEACNLSENGFLELKINLTVLFTEK